MDRVIIYHSGCYDGFCSAWLAHRAFPNATFIPAHYQTPPPDVNGKKVWILDFSFPRDVLLKMKEEATELVVLDHHESAQKALEGLDFCTFDMNKSGARLTYEYMWAHAADIEFTIGSFRTSTPWLVNYTEDRDLWKWQLSNSKEINAALRSYPMDFKVWDELYWAHRYDFSEDAKNLDKLVMVGEALLRYQQSLIDTHVKHAYEIELDGHKVLCVNWASKDLTSELGQELAKGRPFGVTWFDVGGKKRVYSLRSDENGINVAEVAKKFGGGGHAHAAGFTIDEDTTDIFK